MFKGPAQTLALLDSLVEATNADPRLIVAKADLLVEHRQYGRAAELMGEMMDLYPRNPGIMRKLVGVLRAGQADERAQQVLRAWIEQNPGYLVAAVMLARVRSELGNADAARELLEGLAASEPALRANPLILKNLAWLLRDTDPGQARAYAERTLIGDPSSAAIKDTLGRSPPSVSHRAQVSIICHIFSFRDLRTPRNRRYYFGKACAEVLFSQVITGLIQRLNAGGRVARCGRKSQACRHCYRSRRR